MLPKKGVKAVFPIILANGKKKKKQNYFIGPKTIDIKETVKTAQSGNCH